MSRTTNKHDPAKAWLSELLFTRGVFKGPQGKPLYSYLVTVDEYQGLQQLLKNNKMDFRHSGRGKNWAACFCLFVAETFRREYDASSGGWAWLVFERRIGCDFSPSQRAQLLEVGLEQHWDRPIRNRGHGRDLLGSLFAEGGLPWRLVQSETHGFGRAVRGGLKHAGQSRTMTDIMGDYDSYLPMTFRTLESRQLLAGIVEQLMRLVAEHPLSGQSDPAAYLDAVAKDWRKEFPIPLGEVNGRELINDWLKDANQQRSERAAVTEQDRAFTCRHLLSNELSPWQIHSELFLPKHHEISIDPQLLASTRFELGFYEGDTLLARGGVVYGELKENNLTLRFPQNAITLLRKDLTAAVSLRLLESGRQVHVLWFANSELDYRQTPVVFEPSGDEWRFVANVSCSMSGSLARVRVPTGYEVQSVDAVVLATEDNGATWLTIKHQTHIVGNSDKTVFKLRGDKAAQPLLTGRHLFEQSLPNIVYRDWPTLKLADDDGLQSSGLLIYANDKPLAQLSEEEAVGVIRYSVKNVQGEVILRRRFGRVPQSFAITLLPASTHTNASIVVDSPVKLAIEVFANNVRISQRDQVGKTIINLIPRSDVLPARLTLAVRGFSAEKAIEFEFPYPDEGARLMNAAGMLLSNDADLYLSELPGMRLMLSTARHSMQKFYLQMTLTRQPKPYGQPPSPGLVKLRRQYVITVTDAPVSVDLFAYLADMIQLLGAEPDQDNYIKLTVVSDRSLLALNIRHYNGELKWQNKQQFSVEKSLRNGRYNDIAVAALLLSNPQQAPIVLAEKQTQGVGTGFFAIPQQLDNDGPWLIYPDPASHCQFRPQLYLPAVNPLTVDTDADTIAYTKAGTVRSLHQAARVYHPVNAPAVINIQIDAMADDLNHSGWQYLADLKSNFAHLPLSTFESWKALANYPKSLAVLLFRLEVDEAFCQRLTEDVAVIWESISLPLWMAVMQKYKTWLSDTGLPAALQDSVINNRSEVLPAVVPGFEYLKGYLISGDHEQLQAAPLVQVLPIWYQGLRQQFPVVEEWPEILADALSCWIQQQALAAEIQSLSLIHETDAVTYLPIFMAHVSAGQAQLADLGLDLPLVKFAIRLLADFDRQHWYLPVHSLTVSYLLAKTPKE